MVGSSYSIVEWWLKSERVLQMLYAGTVSIQKTTPSVPLKASQILPEKTVNQPD